MPAFLRSVSPADSRDEIGRFPLAGAPEVEAAVARARAAFPAWRDAGLEARARVLRRFAEFVRERQDELARLIAREVGKALWEARGEAALVPAKVSLTLGEGLRAVQPLELAPGVRATHAPRGVLAVLGPFNFPAHLPNGHLVPALATGNTLVWKPSNLAPGVGAWLTEAWHAAGLPGGALELVQGEAETGRALALHPGVDGVLFTGSWAVGRWLQEATLDQPHKILALELGGKNAMVVLRDADLDLAVAEAAVSICATAGQRCTSLSRLFVAETIFEAFTERLVRALAGVRVGPPLEEGIFMGPLVSHAAFHKVMAFRGQAAEAGGERLLGGGVSLPPPFVGPGLVRFSNLTQDHAYQREEIFGPEAALYPITDLEQGIAAVNDSDYGLAASILTRDRTSYERCVDRVQVGILNWNRGTVGASGRLPFGGLKRSGNDRPAGIAAALYCTAPQAHVEHAGGLDPAELPPGMPLP